MKAPCVFAVAFTAVAHAAPSTASNDKHAAWRPNPCDTFDGLPRELQGSFGRLNHVDDLNRITAYNTYIVTHAIPAQANATWGWDTRGETATLTSPYNTASCSSYYPPPLVSDTGSRIVPNGSSIATSNVVASQSAPTTSTSTSTGSAAPKQSSSAMESSGQRSATTVFSVQTNTAEASSAPSDVHVECHEQNKKENITVSPAVVENCIKSFCQDLKTTHPTIQPGTWNQKWCKDSHFGVNLLLQVGNTGNRSTIVPVGDNGKSLSACETNFRIAWSNCRKNAGMGGYFYFNKLGWDVQPQKIANFNEDIGDT